MHAQTDFDSFVELARPSLRRALIGHIGRGAIEDAIAAGMLYAWENWGKVSVMDNPTGYLFRVCQSSARGRRQPDLPPAPAGRLPEVEPELVPALKRLPQTQRTAVWLIDACGWTYAEAATAMEVSASTVGTHRQRGLQALRQALGVVEA